MISALRRLFGCTTAAAAVEAAIFAPIFLTLTIGVTDIGSGMFVRMTVNAAAQAGAAYAVIHSGSGDICEVLTATCLTNIRSAMNQAAGNSSPQFCTVATCTPLITGCADGSPKCITVTASFPYQPIMIDALYSWSQSTTVSYTSTIRVL
jgi:Flp pilus assembly protein TadG